MNMTKFGYCFYSDPQNRYKKHFHGFGHMIQFPAGKGFLQQPFSNPFIMSGDDDSRTDLNESVGDDDDPQGWLQLTVGRGGNVSTSRHGHGVVAEEERGGPRHGLVELDLLPAGPSGASTTTAEVRSPFLPSAPPPPPSAVGSISATPPPYNFMQHPARAFRPATAFHHHPEGVLAGAGLYNIRVIDPPRRPHAGIWFSLQASKNQVKEPYLPQVSKRFLRIKDGRMTVLLVVKYLAHKLQLNNESEIEIRCRGQELQTSLTLQHVRDEIWMQNYVQHGDDDHHSHAASTLLRNLSTSTATNHHIMVLFYGRKRSFNV